MRRMRSCGLTLLRMSVVSTCVLLVPGGHAWATDPPDADPERTAHPSRHVTQGLRTPQPSVRVGSNPMPQDDRSDDSSSADLAFVDENGELSSTPPPGAPLSASLTVPRGGEPVQTVSPVDPNVDLLNTSHMFIYEIAHIDGDGEISKSCVHGAEGRDPGVSGPNATGSDDPPTEPHQCESSP